MHTLTHGIVGWDVAVLFGKNRRERFIYTLVSVLPDLDGLGAPLEILTDQQVPAYSLLHHTFGHNLWFVLLLCGGAYVFLRKKRSVLYTFLLCHFHFLCDLMGSKGPDGSLWGIAYFWPLSTWELSWNYQWKLNAFPNIFFTVIALMFLFYWAWKTGVSILELFSSTANKLFIQTLRNRFGSP